MSKKRTETKTDTPFRKDPVKIEILFSLLLLISLFVWISLLSYDQHAMHRVVSKTFFTGKFGFHIAFELVSIFGYAAFLLPLLLVPLTLGIYFKQLRIHFVWLSMLILLIMPIFQAAKLDPLDWHSTGGLIGSLLLNSLLLPNIGTVGTWLFLLAGLTVALTLIFRTPLFSALFALFRHIFVKVLEPFRQSDKKTQEEPNGTSTPIAAHPREERIKEELHHADTVTKSDKSQTKTQKSEPVSTEKGDETPPPLPKSEAASSDITIETIAQEEDSKSMKRPRSIKNYTLPPLDILAENEKVDIDKKTLEIQVKQTAVSLEEALKTYKIEATVERIQSGPVVTMYMLKLGRGVKVGQVTNLENDLAVVVGGKSVRVVPKIPGTQYIGVEIPNDTRLTIRLRSILSSTHFQSELGSGLPIAIGQDVGGKTVVGNLAKMPHLLVAGTTGSGKSVGINAFIMSLLFTMSPDEVKFIMIDPKGNEFNIYEGIPHLLVEVVTDMKLAAKAMQWAIREMDDRFNRLRENQVRDIVEYNKKREKINKNLQNEDDHLPMMPYIVIIIDEFADLMMTAGKDVETATARIAQKARAAGIHLIIATQKPIKDVITSNIKSNLPSRIAFSVFQAVDSRVILDQPGAEQLLGNGDMLFIPPGERDSIRVQGAFVSTDEIRSTIDFIKEQSGDVAPESTLNLQEMVSSVSQGKTNAEHDALWDDVIELIKRERKCSTSFLQARLRIGHGHASRIVMQLEDEGIIGPPQGSKAVREIFLPEE